MATKFKNEFEFELEDFEGYRGEVQDKMKVAQMLILGYKEIILWLDGEIRKAQ